MKRFKAVVAQKEKENTYDRALERQREEERYMDELFEQECYARVMEARRRMTKHDRPNLIQTSSSTR